MPLLPNIETILEKLSTEDISVEGQFMWGSNYTYLANVGQNLDIIKAVYKPTQGERPLWDFPEATLAGREVAAFLISEAGGWHFVPPTVYRLDGPAGAGSVQFFVEHDPEHHYFEFSTEEKQALSPVALFDAVINNTDRKGGHILVDEDKNFWLIDHGVCFHSQAKLRTVIWDFAGKAIPEEALERLLILKEKLQIGEPLYEQLTPYLNLAEIHAISTRIDKLLISKQFPLPPRNYPPYPWPPV